MELACKRSDAAVGFSKHGLSGDSDFTGKRSSLHRPTPLKPDSVSQIQGIWCVLNVWSGKEFSIETKLTEAGIGRFLPRQDVLRIHRVRQADCADGWRNKRISVTIPYYPTYLFACYRDDAERCVLLEMKGIDNILDVHETDQDQLIATLASLEISYNAQPFMHQGEWQKPGKRVRVKAGAYMGAVGEIAYVDGKSRLHVGIRTLGQPVELDVDPSECEPWSE